MHGKFALEQQCQIAYFFTFGQKHLVGQRAFFAVVPQSVELTPIKIREHQLVDGLALVVELYSAAFGYETADHP